MNVRAYLLHSTITLVFGRLRIGIGWYSGEMWRVFNLTVGESGECTVIVVDLTVAKASINISWYRK